MSTVVKLILPGYFVRFFVSLHRSQTSRFMANLKSAKLMGIESQNMPLAAGTADGPALLSVDGHPLPGAKIS